MKKLGIILIIVAIIFLVALQQQGWEGFKAEPFDSTIQSTKKIGEVSKDVFDKTKETIDNFKNDENNNEGSNPINLGRPFCQEDSDCNTIQQCENNCSCIGGECFLG